MTKRIGIIALAVGFAAGCGGGGGTSGPDPAPAAVTITTFSPIEDQPRWNPSNTEVAVGGTVTWRINPASPVLHNVTSLTNAWTASPDLAANETFQVTFPQAGEFLYRCTIHAGMNGRIEVR